VAGALVLQGSAAARVLLAVYVFVQMVFMVF